MTEKVMLQILQKIRAYDTVMLFRHQRMDGDCVGATKGLQRILRLTFPQKKIWLTDGQTSSYLAFLGPDDPEQPEETYREALGIVLDVATRDRISNPRWRLCREIIKIDHHIETDPYGGLNWVEPQRSSVCEMVVDFARRFRDTLQLDAKAAEYLYTGMVTDSGRFRYEGVCGETMRLAGFLLDTGFDRETLYAHLYMRDFEDFRFESWVYHNMRRTNHGVAYIHVPISVWRGLGLDFEGASNAIGFLENIRGSMIFLAFIESEDGSVRVRLRSRFLAVNELASHFEGGGHANASGATVYSDEEEERLLSLADALLRDYKASHTGWM